jgi:hypothetical protein
MQSIVPVMQPAYRTCQEKLITEHVIATCIGLAPKAQFFGCIASLDSATKQHTSDGKFRERAQEGPPTEEMVIRTAAKIPKHKLR